ncbi:MAG: type II toxin-antitoxin system VapC family toxin [Candidatus Electrothrix communis]|nr:MAG: type II toxin-antitoxin system VapC family toxin [Candidatus Electrothrix communis]
MERIPILDKIQLIVPSLLLDEITEVLCGNLDNLEEVRIHIQYLETLAAEKVLHIVVPDTAVRMRAIAIARTGHAKSGYPELSDSLYHALAIMHDAVFVTNDRRHIAKSEIFGHIMPLAQYNTE